MATVIIQDEPFEIEAPYAEGHTLNAAEAKVLSQTFFENVRNNMAQRFKKNAEGAYASEEQRKAAVAAYVEEYSFAERTSSGVGREKLDPVTKMARVLARNAITANLKKQGREATKEQIEAAVKDAVASRPAFMEKAKKLVADQAAAADELLSQAA